MIDLEFFVTGARPLPHAAAPTLVFPVEIRSREPVHAILLRCQLQIEPRRRGHSSEEQQKLTDLFGEPARWNESLRPLVWTHSTINVPGFESKVNVDLPVACTYDFEVTAAKYLAAVGDHDIPLRFLFSGSVFINTHAGFMVQQIPWSKEAVYRMPIAVWRDLMDLHFPGSAWIRVRRETLELLQRVRAQHGRASWDETFELMLGEGV